MPPLGFYVQVYMTDIIPCKISAHTERRIYMKVLLIETASGGHHDYYASALQKAADETVYIVPEKIEGIASKQIVIDSGFAMKKSFWGYLAWLGKIHRVVKAENPDVIHFLYGDIFYRNFGLGLKYACTGKHSIMTCHHIRRSRLHDFSLRRIAHRLKALVVHTESLKNDLDAMGLVNAVQIDYPEFMEIACIPRDEALAELGIAVQDGDRVLLALGGTRRDKGLDILLEALKTVNGRFHLIVAGEENTYKRDFILAESAGYESRVSLLLEHLDDKKFVKCLNAADIVVLPYRKIFDGASGPLTDGAYIGKMIVGPSHGSIGRAITANHLGLTFEAENVESLSRVIDEALSCNFVPDEKYRTYQERLRLEIFIERYMKLYEGVKNS